MGFLNNIINSLKKASRKRVEINKNLNSIQLLLNSDQEEYFTLTFDTMNVQTLSEPNILEAYSINAHNNALGNLYIEVIRLKPTYEWNISAGSAFDLLIRQSFNNFECQYINSMDSKFAKLSKYQINDNHEIGAIWFSLNQYEVFIVDTKGQLFNDLLSIYGLSNKEVKMTISSDTTQFNPSNSIVSLNLIENFFSKGD